MIVSATNYFLNGWVGEWGRTSIGFFFKLEDIETKSNIWTLFGYLLKETNYKKKF